MGQIVLRTKKQRAVYYFGWFTLAMIGLQVLFLIIFLVAKAMD
jgi:hypothetical protein